MNSETYLSINCNKIVIEIVLNLFISLALKNPLMLQNFKHIMKELQGAIIIASAFQAILGYSGLMTLFLRYEFLALHCLLCLRQY